MWVVDGYGKKAWLDDEQAEHLRANGQPPKEWVDSNPATDAPARKGPGRPRKVKA